MVQAFQSLVICVRRISPLAVRAPITPLADRQLYHVTPGVNTSTIVVNLGGFINWTYLPENLDPEAIRGGDLCACNQVLDAVARHYDLGPYDADGAVAATGTPVHAVVHRWRTWFAAQAQAADTGHSLGTAHAPPARIIAETTNDISAADYLSSVLTAMTATVAATLADVVARYAGHATNIRVLCAGGGVRNQALLSLLDAELHALDVAMSVSVAPDPQAREAMAMAVLAALAEDGVPLTVPAVTGRQQVPNGRWGTWIG